MKKPITKTTDEICASLTLRQKGRGAGEILQKIYDSEIHISIGWMWDGGVDYRIGCDLSEMYTTEEQKKITSTGACLVLMGLQRMAVEVAEEYPNSTFAKWWLSHDPCKGKNCGSTDGITHSPECIEEHEKCCQITAIQKEKDQCMD